MKTKSNEELLVLIREGDEQALACFVEQNQRLVYSLVHRFYTSYQMKEELFQIGCVGLMKAIHQFDFDYHVQFSTYAVPIILGEIKRYFRDNGQIHLSRSLKEQYQIVMKMKESLVQSLQKEPTLVELAEALKWEVEDVVLTMEANQQVHSIDELITNQNGTMLSLQNCLFDAKTEDITLKIALQHEYSLLQSREQLLLYYRYHLEYTQAQIADKLHISQVQVSRIEKKILEKLFKRLT